MSSTQTVTTGAVRRSLRAQHVDVVGYVFAGLLLFSLLFTLAILALLVGDQFQRSLPVFAERGTDFLIALGPACVAGGTTCPPALTFGRLASATPEWTGLQGR